MSEPARGDGAARSLSLLESRAAAIPGFLSALLRDGLALPDVGQAARSGVLTTGVGASEGPARMLAAVLRSELDLSARFVPLSCFVGPSTPRAGLLVIFSQGLSPNATLALERAALYPSALLFTSVAASDAEHGTRVAALARGGAHVVVLPPAEEGATLVRLVGPAVASLAALMLVEQLGASLGRAVSSSAASGLVPRVIAAAGAPAGPLPRGRLAFVVGSEYGELCHGLARKALEGLLVPEPPLWDILGLSHGAFQQFYEEPLTLLALEGPGSVDQALLAPLAEMLVPERHRLVRLRATLAGPLGFFEHDAQLNALLLATLRDRPRDLFTWPAQGRDAPLYGVGAPRGAR